MVAGLAVLARIDTLLLVALLGALQLWRGPRRLVVPGAVAGAVVLAPWWIWCTMQFGTPVPTSGDVAHSLAPVQPFSRDSMAQVAGAVAGGPFDVWRSLREWLNDHPVAGMAVFWLIVLALVALGVWWARRRVMPQLAVAALPVFARGVAASSTRGSASSLYFTRYLAPVACIVSLILAVVIAHGCGARAAPGGSRRSSPPRSCCSSAWSPRCAPIRTEPHRRRRRPISAFDSVTGISRRGAGRRRRPAGRAEARRVAERGVRLLRERPLHGGEPRRRRQPRLRRRRATARFRSTSVPRTSTGWPTSRCASSASPWATPSSCSRSRR